MKFVDITSVEAFGSALAEHDFCLVDFYKDNCPGCAMLTNTFKALDTDFSYRDVTVLKVKLEDVGEDFFKEQGLRQTPTVKFYIDGEAVIVAPGFSSPATMKSLIKQAQSAL